MKGEKAGEENAKDVEQKVRQEKRLKGSNVRRPNRTHMYRDCFSSTDVQFSPCEAAEC